VIFSPFFNALPMRRTGVYLGDGGSVAVPVIYLRVPELSLDVATISYTPETDGITVDSPVAPAMVKVDNDGFILDYPGLAERI